MPNFYELQAFQKDVLLPAQSSFLLNHKLQSRLMRYLCLDPAHNAYINPKSRFVFFTFSHKILKIQFCGTNFPNITFGNDKNFKIPWQLVSNLKDSWPWYV